MAVHSRGAPTTRRLVVKSPKSDGARWGSPTTANTSAPTSTAFSNSGHWTPSKTSGRIAISLRKGLGGKDRGMNPYYHGRGIFGYDAAKHAETKPGGGADFTVGARYAVGSFTKEASKGRFGGLAVFDRALSDSEMKTLHDSAGIEALNSPNADAQRTGTDSTPYPRIAMLWSPVRGDGSLKSFARHDLLMMGLGALRLQLDAEPRGLSDGFHGAFNSRRKKADQRDSAIESSRRHPGRPPVLRVSR